MVCVLNRGRLATPRALIPGVPAFFLFHIFVLSRPTWICGTRAAQGIVLRACPLPSPTVNHDGSTILRGRCWLSCGPFCSSRRLLKHGDHGGRGVCGVRPVGSAVCVAQIASPI